MNGCRIVLVDDHSLFRNGLRGLLDRCEGCRVVAEAACGEEFLAMLPGLDAEVVFMDISMPGMNGDETAERALRLRPELKIITLSMFGDENYYTRMVEAGARGFLLKDSSFEEVLRAVETVQGGGSYFSEGLLASLAHRMRTREGRRRTSCRGANARSSWPCAAVCRIRRSPMSCSYRNARWTSTGPTFSKRRDARIRRASWSMPYATGSWRFDRPAVAARTSERLRALRLFLRRPRPDFGAECFRGLRVRRVRGGASGCGRTAVRPTGYGTNDASFPPKGTYAGRPGAACGGPRYGDAIPIVVQT